MFSHPFPDPDRVALAIDALCVGTRTPVLIHGESEARSPDRGRPWALLFTPLDDLESLDGSVAVLAAVRVPPGWGLAGLCAPTTVRTPGGTDGETRRHDAWIVHVVHASGGAASRLCVPDALELSGPIPTIDATDPLHRCLARLVGRPGRSRGSGRGGSAEPGAGARR